MRTTKDFDGRQLRRVLGNFFTGVTIVTTIDDTGKPWGVTANSFTSVSLDPPLILWSQARASPSHPVFRDAERFVVNIVAEHQIAVSERFSRPSKNKFEGLPVTSGLGGLPLINGCAAILECRKVATYPGGDHSVFMGHVERIGSRNRRPLVFGGGKYMVAQAYEAGERSCNADNSGLRHALAVRTAATELRNLSAELEETVALSIWTAVGPVVVHWEPESAAASGTLCRGVVPLLESATGRLFTALMPRAEVAIVLRNQGQSDLFADDVAATLDEIREQGHSIRELERPGLDSKPSQLRSLSVPIVDAKGVVRLAITVLRRRDAGMSEDKLLKHLKLKARGISRRLGQNLALV